MGQSHADDEGDDKVIAAIVALDRAKLVLEIVTTARAYWWSPMWLREQH